MGIFQEIKLLKVSILSINIIFECIRHKPSQMGANNTTVPYEKKNQYKHKHLLAVKSVCDKMLLVQTV